MLSQVRPPDSLKTWYRDTRNYLIFSTFSGYFNVIAPAAYEDYMIKMVAEKRAVAEKLVGFHVHYRR